MKGQKYLYTVYRNGTDEMLALDVDTSTCAEIMGIKKQTLHKLFCRKNGVNGKWTVIRERIGDADEYM